MEAEESSVTEARVQDEPVRFAESRASVWLDGLRGVAALLVLGEHWRNALYVDYPALERLKPWLAVPYLLTGVGHQMVMVFFVLSGYLIGGSVFRAVESGRWSWRRYGAHRLVRLWVVLLPGLLLCLLWDRVALALQAAGALRLNWMYGPMATSTAAASALLGLRSFWGNVFFVQSIRVHAYGSDGPLWSLSYEFWYYVLLPLGWLCVRGGARAWVRAVYGAVFVGVFWWMGEPLRAAFPVWLMGAVLAQLPVRRWSGRVRWAVVLGYVPVVFWVAKQRWLGAEFSDDLLGLATLALLWVVLGAQERADAQARGVRVARRTARFSYTLYVVHLPLLLLVGSAMQRGGERWLPGWRTVGVGLAALGVVMVYCYAVAWGTEFHTARVRVWVERRLGLAEEV